MMTVARSIIALRLPAGIFDIWVSRLFSLLTASRSPLRIGEEQRVGTSDAEPRSPERLDPERSSIALEAARRYAAVVRCVLLGAAAGAEHPAADKTDAAETSRDVRSFHSSRGAARRRTRGAALARSCYITARGAQVNSFCLNSLSECSRFTYNAQGGSNAPAHGRGMNAERRGAEELGRSFISYRLAVAVIAILFGASAAGWIATEIVPPDFLEREDLYRKRGGRRRQARLDASSLRSLSFLLVSFHARSLLRRPASLRRDAVEAACAGSWRVPPPAAADDPAEKGSPLNSPGDFSRAAPASRDPLVRFAERFGRAELDGARLRGHFSSIAALLRKRGFSVVSRERGDGIRFAAFSGRWRSPGTMLFHWACSRSRSAGSSGASAAGVRCCS